MIALALSTLACGREAPGAEAEIWPEADQLFRGDARFIGGDGAYSVDLGAGRVLWLFGDTFVALGPERLRSHMRMVRNSLAIQTGYDPSNAFVQFYWRSTNDEPQSYYPEEDYHWFWPGHGIRIDDRLLLFYGALAQAEAGSFGFAGDGWTGLLITNPDDEPSAWTPTRTLPPDTSYGLDVGGAVLRDGPWLYVYATGDKLHDIYLLRFDVDTAMHGDLRSPEWWCGDSGWQLPPNVGDRPTPVVDGGAPEYSVHHDERLGAYVLVHGDGFGPTTIDWRVADRPEGPFTQPRDLIRPPESFEPDAFNYAAKGHPELAGADLVLTYVPSAFEDAQVSPEFDEVLYYPHFVRVGYR